MSTCVLVDTEDWVGSDCVSIGDTGFGLTGAEIEAAAAAGSDGAGYALESILARPGYATKEYCGRLGTIPTGLTIKASEATDFEASANDGSYDVPWTFLEEGADIGSATLTLVFGAISATALGATLTGTSSLIAGSATGSAVGTAPGATLTGASTLVAGSATGQGNATAPGATLTGTSSLSAGAAEGTPLSIAPGATLTATSSITGGSAAGQQSATAPGATLTALATLIAGGASAPILVASDANTYRGVPRVRTIGGSRVHFSPMRPAEEEIIAFDFVDTVASGVTVVSVVELKNTVVIGVDPDVAGTIKGSSISETTVSVMVGDLKPGVTYQPRCVALMSNGEIKELPDQGQGYLRVTV